MRALARGAYGHGVGRGHWSVRVGVWVVFSRMHKSIRTAADCCNREGRRASTRRVDSQEDVLRVDAWVSRRVFQHRCLALQHVLNIAGGKCFFRTVGGNSQGLAQPARKQSSTHDQARLVWGLERVCAVRTAWPDPLRTHTTRSIQYKRRRVWCKEAERTGQQLPHDLHLGTRQPAGHGRELVTAFFGVIGKKALVANLWRIDSV